MIEGYRTSFDLGAGAALHAQNDSALARRAEAVRNEETRADKATSGVAQANVVGVAPEVRPVTPVSETQDSARSEERPSDHNLRDLMDPTFEEPALPRLSAEALATALMTAAPDKAVVPRVLPAEMADKTTAS